MSVSAWHKPPMTHGLRSLSQTNSYRMKIVLNTGMQGSFGIEIFNDRGSPKLASSSFCYSYMFDSVKGGGHSHQDNGELLDVLFTGARFPATSEWLIGLTSDLQCNSATGSWWIPYVNVGSGEVATSIGPPDLSHTCMNNRRQRIPIKWTNVQFKRLKVRNIEPQQNIEGEGYVKAQ